jgi:hypothetical protein
LSLPRLAQFFFFQKKKSHFAHWQLNLPVFLFIITPYHPSLPYWPDCILLSNLTVKWLKPVFFAVSYSRMHLVGDSPNPFRQYLQYC